MESDEEEGFEGEGGEGYTRIVTLEEVLAPIQLHCLPAGASPLDFPVKPKVDPWVFFRETLKSPRHIMAPMVDGSDLAYRLLSRRYDTHVTFTPMIHSYGLL